MKLRKAICIAAAISILCALCPMAAADGYSTPVNIMQYSVRPLIWEAQPRDNGDEMTWYISNLFDGYRETRMEHVCWNNESLDDIPEITFYFGGATIRDIWIRNGYDNNDELYLQYARPYRIEIAVWVGNEEEPRGQYVFNKLPDSWDASVNNGEYIDGYRCLSLPHTFSNVTRIGLFIKGWHKGEEEYRTKYIMQISDLAFLADWPGSGGYNPGYDPYYYPTAVPTLVPTLTPVPLITEAPFSGLQVITKERLSTRSGPGTDYTEAGSYFQSGTWVRAITSAYDRGNGIWWVQVELSYNGELRRVYTGVKRLQMAADQVPIEETEEGSAVVTRSVYPYWGPGYGYTMYGEKIPAGTAGTVWQRENLYAQFEYRDGSGQLRRVWVPENALEEDDAVG